MMTLLSYLLAISTAPLSSSSSCFTGSRSSLSFSSYTSLFQHLPHPRSSRVGIRCSYAGAGIKENVNRDTIDIVVLGGSGFVGSAICKAVVSKGIEVISLNRSVSTPGGFGNEEQMQRINGEANVVAVNAAKEYGIPRFILILVHDYNLPSFLLTSGYFIGKRKAESEVLSKYPNSGVVLRLGFIYGKRKVDGFEIRLDLIGKSLEKLLSAIENFTKLLSSLPASDLFLALLVSVDDVAYAVINAVRDDDSLEFSLLSK